MVAQLKKPRKVPKHTPKVSKESSKAILAMRTAGMSLPAIGRETGLTPSGVWRHLRRVAPENTEFQTIKNNLADQFAIAAIDNLNLSAKLTKYLTELPEDELKDIGPVNIAAIKRTADVALGIAHDHFRLESNQSTSNNAIMVGFIQAIQGKVGHE